MTPRQLECLRLIDASIRETGCPPSYAQLCERMGMKSKGGMNRLVTALESMGYIRRSPRRARAIEVVRMPDDAPDERDARIADLLAECAALRAKVAQLERLGAA